ncbi:hypothetical protein HELRODRAFT_178654 [Helobdella robusta]|uniref:Troponin T n=1 Tax=Helobdella robusta TaxID=6412 RepID=T1FDI4_HELRO|nr:hypothetical protein HELRODRAFT_178654 [Helobdella robusta]ESN96854.1 hypothetical protein HELRODRAFT_178654 [Helobdella robusta]
MSSDEESPPPKKAPAPKKKTTSAIKSDGLDEASVELLEANKRDRDRMEEEIQELRARAEKRKKQRDIEEKRMAAERAAEDERRKAVEEEKRKKKEEDEQNTIKERARKLAEFEKLKNPGKPNFVISKKNEDGSEVEEEVKESKKSKEQLDAEKKAILSQRIMKLDIAGFDSGKLTEKAKELLKMIYKLEGEKYDLEKRFKTQQSDLMELAEKARQANKVGVDIIQTKFAGAPAKIEMFSKYERQKDKREYGERKDRFAGPQFVPPVDKIKPTKFIQWDEEGMPLYSQSQAEQAAQ